MRKLRTLFNNRHFFLGLDWRERLQVARMISRSFFEACVQSDYMTRRRFPPQGWLFPCVTCETVTSFQDAWGRPMCRPCLRKADATRRHGAALAALAAEAAPGIDLDDDDETRKCTGSFTVS